jgi:glycosyltransferase involved in cell wall biosynthesis
MWYDEELFFEKKWLNLFNKKNNEIIFTYIWTLNKERNLDIFIKAFISNLEKFKNIKLYFIWFWNWEENLKNISWKYLNKNIFFLW